MSEQYTDARVERRMQLRRLKKQRLKKIFRVLAVSFCVFLGVIVLINLIKPKKTFSESENRMLTTAPAVTTASLADGSFMTDVESFVSDQFFLRDQWITLKVTADRFLGKKESNGVYLGKHKYLMGIPDAPNNDLLARKTKAIQDFYSRHTDLNIVMTLVPNACYVLKNEMPANAPIPNQPAQISQIKNELGSSVHFRDVTSALSTHTKENIYYKTDHHWTTLGAYYAFRELTEDLNIKNAIENYTIYNVADDFSGTLASKSGYHGAKDVVQIYTPADRELDYVVTYGDTMETSGSMYRSECLNDKDKYTVFFGGNHSLVTIESPTDDGRVLLVFKDSYANCFIPFLVPYFSKIIIVDPRYYYESIDQVITRNSVTDVLYLYNLDTFMTDACLADALAPDENAAPAPQPDPIVTTDTSTDQNKDTDDGDSEDTDSEDSNSYDYTPYGDTVIKDDDDDSSYGNYDYDFDYDSYGDYDYSSYGSYGYGYDYE